MAERRRRRLLQRLLSGSKNIRFAEAVACAEAFGFRLSRISGSHHIYVHADIPELVNLQNVNYEKDWSLTSCHSSMLFLLLTRAVVTLMGTLSKIGEW